MRAIGEAASAGGSDQIRARVVSAGCPVDLSKRLVIEEQHIVGADFSSSALESFCAIASRFEGCSFSRVKIGDAVWGGGRKPSTYLNCSFNGAKFRSIVPGNVRFENCTFRDVRIYEFLAHDVELFNCVFSGRIDRGFLSGTRRREARNLFSRARNQIVNNDFSECDLVDFTFRAGVDLTLQRLPTGPMYVYVPHAGSALKRARRKVQRWSDPEARRLGSILIDVAERDVKAGQTQLLLRWSERDAFAQAAAGLREILRETDPEESDA